VLAFQREQLGRLQIDQDPVARADREQLEIAGDLHPLAERSLLAHLLKLAKDGRARADAHGRYAAI
jgi:hypothetical protein